MLKSWKYICTGVLAGLLSSASAQAEEVTLKTIDGTLTLTGDLLDFDGRVYKIQTLIGSLEIDVASVTCEGSGCPAVEEKTEFAIAVGDGVNNALLANLLEEYAFQEEMTAEQRVSGSTGGTSALEMMDDSDEVKVSVSVQQSDTQSALTKLIDGSAAIALTTRPVAGEEISAFTRAGFADPSLPGQETVIALDALVPIVAPGNRTRAISLEELALIASGQIQNWAQLGGQNAPIRMILPREESSTFETFNRLVIDANRARVNGNIERADSEETLADEVARDPNAIGVVSLSARRNAEVVPIRRVCGPLAKATPFAVKAEEYPLTRRVFMYVSGAPVASRITDLIAFAGSGAAQDAIQGVGFIDQGIMAYDIDNQGIRLAAGLLAAPTPAALQQMRDLSLSLVDSQRLSTTFRFTTGSSRLDNKALGDVDRMVEFLNSEEVADKEVLVIGFTDSIGREDLNILLGQSRAEQVRESLITASGGTLTGDRIVAQSFGPLAPIGCNETAEGRTINRRVEIWIRDRV
ncbi:phosphate ABC transporter substrate-binding/OmpA family protein [Algicella marina]|uniref:OmpA family protein n=1 Tax=Algicella marina TaxID=2683284 RepID=A0A6P1T1Y2_9RHOB|nr:phosphate ABC transporter substrate-binding/OmpA family protein [Algicella marina]QHQ36934.1 OmpA family protein [Algicella marina]